uniref:Uncharacterized protein n=1 Tax=Noctiluca scintillans TaxID=2966 RepID=A0A7S1AL49_NOCSC
MSVETTCALPCCLPDRADAIKMRMLGSAHEVMACHRSPHILGSYRLKPPCFSQLFFMHNETLNIWTHLVGALYFAHRTFTWVADAVSRGALVEHPGYSVLVLLMLAASFSCMMASSTYHWRACASQQERSCFLQLDRSGIIGIIGMSFATSITVGYSCNPYLQRAYMMLAFVVIVSTTATLVLPKLRTHTAPILITCGCAGLLPCIHWFFVARSEMLVSSAAYVVMSAVGYLGGAVFYVGQMPERWRPGYFDLFGQSHQIFHTLVLVAAACMMEAVIGIHTLLADETLECS